MLDARNVAALRDGLLRRAASTFIFAFLEGSALSLIGALTVLPEIQFVPCIVGYCLLMFATLLPIFLQHSHISFCYGIYQQ